MNNVLLGKTIKAMYKLSGKTLVQLSDETGLTVDTINNLFYARIRKPGIAGICDLVGAMGFSVPQLLEFMDANPDLPEEADVTELFTEYISTAKNTETAVPAAKVPAPDTNGSLSGEIELLNAEHERVLDRFRSTHQRYVERMQNQFDSTREGMRAAHAKEIDRLEREITHARKTIRVLGITVGIETAVVLLIMVLDLLNRSIGWMR